MRHKYVISYFPEASSKHCGYFCLRTMGNGSNKISELLLQKVKMPSRTWRACVLTCLRTYVLVCLMCSHACLLTCWACLGARVLGILTCLRVLQVLSMLACLLYVLMCLHVLHASLLLKYLTCLVFSFILFALHLKS